MNENDINFQNKLNYAKHTPAKKLAIENSTTGINSSQKKHFDLSMAKNASNTLATRSESVPPPAKVTHKMSHNSVDLGADNDSRMNKTMAQDAKAVNDWSKAGMVLDRTSPTKLRSQTVIDQRD